jgi:ketosteroid isomerase-like protein
MPAGSDAGARRPIPGWGHATGAIAMRPAAVWGAVPAELLPEVQQCVNRYSWAFDERREDALRECFTEDAVWEASAMGETAVGPFTGRDAVLGWLTRFWPRQRDQRRHVFTNWVVDEADGDEVTAYCYLQLFGSSGGESRFETAGFARFVLRREGARLAIRRFTAGFDSPFWSMPVEDMGPALRELFGILDVPSD